MKYDMLQERRTPTHKTLYSIASEGSGDSTAGYPTQWVSGMKEIGGWRKQTTPEIALWNLSGPGGAGAGDSTLVSPTWSVGGVTGQDPEDQACTLRRHRKTALWNLWGPRATTVAPQGPLVVWWLKLGETPKFKTAGNPTVESPRPPTNHTIAISFVARDPGSWAKGPRAEPKARAHGSSAGFVHPHNLIFLFYVPLTKL